MLIRKATKEDIPAMLNLIKELADFEKAPEEVTVDPLHFEESGFGPNPVWWAFVAESPSTLSTLSTLSAFALYYIRYSTWKGQVMYLEDLIVTEKSRRMGIGKLLIDRLIEEAKEKGFKRIVWQVLDWNEPAIEFYRRYQASFESEWLNAYIDF